MQEAGSAPAPWEAADTITSVLVNISLLLAAVAAVVKFQVLSMFRRRLRSEIACSHQELPNGRTVFLGDYTIYNTGERPLALSTVTLQLYPARLEGVLLVPDRERLLAERLCSPGDRLKPGLFEIGANERSIFTLRCELPALPDIVFLIGEFTWPYRRPPASFIGLYVKRSRALPSVRTAPSRQARGASGRA